MERIWLFGAGKLGNLYIEKVGKERVIGFIDNGVLSVENKKINEIMIYNFNDFMEKKRRIWPIW